jgi:hypothetical protein
MCPTGVSNGRLVPQALFDMKAEADALMAGAEHEYRRQINRQFITEENTVYADNDKCCTSNPETVEQWVKRAREEAKRAERHLAESRKAEKKAKRRERQRQDDIATALDALVEVATASTDPHARAAAATQILAHYSTNY